MKKNSTHKKYIISFGDREGRFDAGSKSPMDAIRFLKEEGWRLMVLPYLGIDESKRKWLLPGHVLKLLFCIKPGSEVLFIYPCHMWQITIINLLKFILRPWYRLLGIKSTAFVMDINSVRFYDGDPSLEISVLNCMDRIIVHSPQMDKFVRDRGYAGESSILGLVDYSVEKSSCKVRTLSHEICFAGNLKKSEFLRTIDFSCFSKAKFFFYGQGFTEEISKSNTEYKGLFSPEDLSGVEGSWGLVWDGDSAKALDGFLGRYMKMNSPHKASMYACAGLPLIVPEGSFVADVVREKGLGLILNDLNDLDSAIGNVTESEYATMLENVHAFAERLTHGRQLKDAISS